MINQSFSVLFVFLFFISTFQKNKFVKNSNWKKTSSSKTCIRFKFKSKSNVQSVKFKLEKVPNFEPKAFTKS